MKALLKIATVASILALPAALLSAQSPATTPKLHKTAAASLKPGLPAMPRFRFENFTTANGLPDDHVFSVLVDGNRIWAATENGLGLYENG
jgi:hypothetical protein